ncbi:MULTISPECIES: hypothetical protein [Candidatus Nitrosocaldus]|jgi:hypothetical protein|uniref:Uncharacterized protein n=1 Tax=Candidatus Nitrosocaldus cavascurensis TaxID=2058097 RepID=A0A2K5AQB2_9ARCH|nr:MULTISPECIES: hypothetical protein [Candidatus Nitrosocaldus]GBC72902.1 hypothetical protein HRbin04_00297 [archaeon HR04]SPC33807.1 protein of unknown function [Candidatus Nitrosocaldus cavascurensis]
MVVSMHILDEDLRIQMAYILGVLVGKGLDDPKAICMLLKEWVRINEPEVEDKDVTTTIAEIVQVVKRIERWRYC